MFLALGTGAYVAAVFHVMTHAFFKALLFLGSGSVIHAMSGEADVKLMKANEVYEFTAREMKRDPFLLYYVEKK